MVVEMLLTIKSIVEKTEEYKEAYVKMQYKRHVCIYLKAIKCKI